MLFLFLAVLGYFIAANIAIHRYARSASPAHADTMIILGAQIVGDPARPGKTLRERLETATAYLHDNPALG